MIRIPSPRARKRARIEIIPLIDLMFFLLATFMMVSLSMARNEGIKIRLPSASSATPSTHAGVVSIVVESTGRYHWNQDAVDFPELQSRLQALKLSQPDASVFIKGDGRAPLESVVAVLDEARKAGLPQVTIQTVRPKN